MGSCSNIVGLPSNSNEIYSVFFMGTKKNDFLKLHSPAYAYVYYLNERLNLLTGEREAQEIKGWSDSLNAISLKENHKNGRVIHFFYEYGFIAAGMANKIPATMILAIDIEYTQHCSLIIEGKEFKNSCTFTNRPGWASYQEAFHKGMASLKKGDCYQFNLTFPFEGLFTGRPPADELISLLWADKNKRGAYAHGTVIPPLKKMYVSNSPECLFQGEMKNDILKLTSFPIKGTFPLETLDQLEVVWKKLSSSVKNTAELFMISDLLRNDLTKIEGGVAKIVNKRRPLVVPNILHQYAEIEVLLFKKYFLGPIIEGVFPGGSITGAPKKRVMKILSELENSQRGFYCGSTVLLFKCIKAASINIRSLEYDLSTFKFLYHAGGGITLLSDCEEEYEEMCLKVNSFFDLINR